MRSYLFLPLLGVLSLTACGMNEQEAREAAQKRQLPPTEVQLMKQTKAGNDRDAKMLVEAGVNPNTQQQNGMTVLMSAAFNGQHDTAKALLERGADANAEAKGYDALGLAVEKGDIAMIKLLVANGADPRRQPQNGKSAEQRARVRPDADAMLSAMQLK